MAGGYFDVPFGNWLPEEEDVVEVGRCPQCGEAIYEGDDVIRYDGDYYCEVDCLLGSLYAYSTTAERKDS